MIETSQGVHRTRTDVIVLVGGPYASHVFSGDGSAPEASFLAEPIRDLYGRPSVCAPRPVDGGPVVYKNTGGRNFLGDPLF